MGVPKRIRVWMAVKDCRFADLARKFNRSQRFVSFFLMGERTSAKMVDSMVKEGCPVKYFKNGRVLEDKDGRI